MGLRDDWDAVTQSCLGFRVLESAVNGNNSSCAFSNTPAISFMTSAAPFRPPTAFAVTTLPSA